MKKSKCVYYLILVFFSLVNYACASEEDKPDSELIVSTDNITFTKDGGNTDIHIKTNQEWSISSSETWCTVSPNSGNETGTIKITVSATENTTTDTRSATISIVAGSIKKQITVTQALSNLLVVKKKEYSVNAEGGNITIELQSTGVYDTEVNGDWISKSTVKSVSNTTLTFSISPNNQIYERKGSITFKLASLSETVSIIQTATSLIIAPDQTGVANNAQELAAKMRLGWNLGNTLEATDGTNASETLWGNPVASKKLIDAVKSAGFNTVRIPCAWNAFIENQSTYKIKESRLARVKEVVDYCVNNNMYAIINIHWDGGWLETNPTYDKQTEVNKKQKALWEQIAVYFRNYDEHLLFAGTNEVHADYGEPSNENIAVQQSYNQTFVDAVRSTGGKNAWRNLIVQSYNTNIDHAVKYMKMPTDTATGRLMAEVHYYDPYEFCIKEDNSVFLWGKDFTGAGTASWGQEDWVEKQFAKMKTNFVDKGIPVVLGEYAVTLRASLGTVDYANHIIARNYYLKYVTKAAVQNGIIPVYWDNGPTGDKASGLFNRLTGEQVHSDAIKSIIEGGK